MIRKDGRGFTLLETLLVLLILMVVTTVVMSFSYKHLKEDQYEQAIERFRLTLHESYMVAQEENRPVDVYIVKGRYVKTKRSIQQFDEIWELPEGMKITIYTTKTYITFTSKGSVAELGKVEITTPYKTIQYSINMSKGRLRLIE
ncbi:MAG: prepilin-type N-terminal cleavage/methylation domain-containing protein [Lysinibacillus sp.]